MTTTTKFDQMLLEAKKARRQLCESRPGSDKGKRAEAKLERLCEQAERSGFLAEFCATLNSTTFTR